MMYLIPRHQWMHHTINETPKDEEKKYLWQKKHLENQTGTTNSYKPNLEHAVAASCLQLVSAPYRACEAAATRATENLH